MAARYKPLFFSGALLCTLALAQEPRSIGALDVGRVEELYHLTDVLGEKIWPGFDTRKIPIAVNCDDHQELLLNHPRPPVEYKESEQYKIDGKPVLIRKGCSRYGPRGGGWAVSLGGAQAAYVCTLQKGQSTDSWLSLLLHECFHVYQKEYRQRAEGRLDEFPEDDAAYSALIGVESRILHAILKDRAKGNEKEKETRELCKMFIAVRHERRHDLSEALIRREGEAEYSEGTATYSQARMLQLLAENGGIEPLGRIPDPRYAAFAKAGQDYRNRYIRAILPSSSSLITFFHAQYKIGMAQCLVLDRVRPGWKEEMRKRGATQFGLLEKELPMQPAEEGRLVAVALEKFDFADLLSAQKKILNERLAKIRGFIEGPGRRYRVYHGDIRGRFKWKPKGPVYHVPPSLMKGASRNRATIWAGGIARFEKTGLLFQSGKVPIVFRSEYLEWIDRDPEEDGSDLVIESSRLASGVHENLKLETDGFVLRAARARIRSTEKLVEIHPLPGVLKESEPEKPRKTAFFDPQPSIRFLLEHQEKDGSFIADPSYRDREPAPGVVMMAPRLNYFYDDSMAVTALCARALLTFHGEDSKPVEAAVGFLERTMKTHDQRYRSPNTSPIWQAYALDLFLDLHASDAPRWRKRKGEFAKMVEQILGYLEAGECEGGGWTYAYYDSSKGTARTFTTALVLRSLLSARERGFPIPTEFIDRAIRKLEKVRLSSGGYRYLYDRQDWPPRVTPMGSIGRMALIEGTLIRARGGEGDRGGGGEVGRLEKVVEAFFRHRELLEQAVDKQTKYGNEGCHYYFSYYHLAEVLSLLPEDLGRDYAQRVGKVLRSHRRKDGSFWDSKRAGPQAGTALALLALAELGQTE